MTRQDAITTARNSEIDIQVLIAAARLNAKQSAWVLDFYTRLNEARYLHEAQESTLSRADGWRRDNLLTEYHQTLRQTEANLLDKVDEAFQRVFQPGPEFEPCFQHCDGEITFACSEAMFRLRAIVLFHTERKEVAITR